MKSIVVERRRGQYMPSKGKGPEVLAGPIPIMRPSLPPIEEYVKRLEKIWDSRMLSNFGENARELETKARKYLGNKHVQAVSSCDTALVLGIAALQMPRGSECVVTPFTFNSTVNSIIWNGLKPHFADIDPLTFNLDPSSVENALTPNTRAIMATHVFGNPCDIKGLKKIADRHNLHLVFDAAHAYGSLYNGKKIGSFGDIETFSLSGTKLVTGGEGGLLATKSAGVASKFEMLRNYGFLGDYNSIYAGLNGKISELNAALACLTIDTIEASIGVRNRIAGIYHDELECLEGVEFQSISPHCRCAYKDFAIRLKKGRNRIEKHLSSEKIQTKRYFLPAHTMPAFSGFASDDLRETERLYSEILCLPMYNEMDDSTVRRVCDAIIRAAR